MAAPEYDAQNATKRAIQMCAAMVVQWLQWLQKVHMSGDDKHEQMHGIIAAVVVDTDAACIGAQQAQRASYG